MSEQPKQQQPVLGSRPIPAARNTIESGDWQEVTFGMPDVWIKRTPTGRIGLVKSKYVMREAHKELAVIKGTPTITAKGYYKLNQTANLAIYTPDSIKIPDADGGTKQAANPYMIIDPESGTARGVWVKKLVLGYGPLGNMAITATTIYYDFQVYFLNELHNEVKNNRQAGRICRADQRSEEEKNTWLFVPIQGDLGIVADPENKAILDIITNWLQNKQFGERKAQTIAERNCLKRHPALSGSELFGVTGPKDNRIGTTMALGWQHDHTADELEEIAMAANEDGQVRLKSGEMIEVEPVTETIDYDDADASADDDMEEGAF